MVMARTQVLVQFTDDLLGRLDEHAARVSRSRSELIREAVQGYLDATPEGEIDRAIVEGYRRIPPGELDDFSDAGGFDLIDDEPW